MKLNRLSRNLTAILPTLLLPCLLLSCSNGSSGNSAAIPAESIIYTVFRCPGSVNVSFPGVSGIREVSGSASDVYITGGYVQYGSNHGFLYQGPLLGGGVCHAFNYPSSVGVTVTSTSTYGPDNNGSGNVAVVGSYTTRETGSNVQLGFLYLGAADGMTLNGWRSLNPASLTIEPILNTLGHSTMGGVVVGNYDINPITGKGFAYVISTDSYYNLIIPGGSASVTAYGIWYNGGTNYTITGGYSVVEQGGKDIGFIADWDSLTQRFSNFTTLNYNGLAASQVGTHFEGITSDGAGGYNLSGDWQPVTAATVTATFAHVPRNPNGSFGTASWTNLGYPGSTATSANTVYQNNVLGLYTLPGSSLDYGYVATIVAP